MKKSTIVFLLMGSAALLACQLQYLVSGQPTSTTEKAKATATLNADSSYPGPNQPPPPPPAGTAPTVITANDDLVIRSTASTVAPSVGQLKKGDVAQVMARTASNDWFQVAIFSGLIMIQGWVPGNQVTVEGPLDKIQVVQPALPPPASSSSKVAPPPPPPASQPYPASSQKTAPTPTRKTYP